MTAYGLAGALFFGYILVVGASAAIMDVLKNKAKTKKRRIARKKLIRNHNKQILLKAEKEKRLLYYEILGGAYDN